MKGLKKSVLLMLVGGLTLGVVGCSSSDGDKTQLEEIKMLDYMRLLMYIFQRHCLLLNYQMRELNYHLECMEQEISST